MQGYHNLSDDLAMCSELFGLSPDDVAANVDFTNLFYGGAAPAASRVLFPNGDVDPWHALGVLESPDANASEPVYTCYGCSHHFWTHPDAALGGDLNAAARATKAAIQDQVMAWLEEP